MTIFDLSLVSLLGVMIWLFRQHCYAGGRLHINPLFGLLAGSFYYVVVPCVFIGYFGELVVVITVYDHYFTAYNATFCLFFMTVVLLSVGLGLSAARRIFRSRHKSATSLTGRTLASGALPFAGLCVAYFLLLVMAYPIRDSLFDGYDPNVLTDMAVWSQRGSMSSLYSMMAVFQLALFLRNWKAPLGTATKLAMLVIFASSSVLLLSMGARLYVIMALLSFLAMYSHCKGGISASRLLCLVIMGFMIFGGIGVLRLGGIDGLTSIFINVVAEPTLTSISSFSMIAENDVPLFGKPYLFPADFQAIIPSVFFPGKELLFERLKDYGYFFESPIGGYHLLFSLLINFGVLGTLFVAGLCGIGLGALKANLSKFSDQDAWRVTMAMLTGVFAFSLFRDPFFVSVVKNVFLTSVIIPVVVHRWMYRRPRRRASVATQSNVGLV